MSLDIKADPFDISSVDGITAGKLDDSRAKAMSNDVVKVWIKCLTDVCSSPEIDLEAAIQIASILRKEDLKTEDQKAIAEIERSIFKCKAFSMPEKSKILPNQVTRANCNLGLDYVREVAKLIAAVIAAIFLSQSKDPSLGVILALVANLGLSCYDLFVEFYSKVTCRGDFNEKKTKLHSNVKRLLNAKLQSLYIG
jgi:hypothetical protein